MKQRFKTRSTLWGTLVAGALAAPLAGNAGTKAAPAADLPNAATTTAAEPAPMDSSDRRMSSDAQSQRAELESALKSGQTPAEMRQQIQALGYQVTAINERASVRALGLVTFLLVRRRSR